MSANWNEYTYAKQFEGNLHGSSEPVPMRVYTNLRILAEEEVREIEQQDPPRNHAPLYVFDRRKDLPLHPSLQATGRHYFRW